MEKTNSDQFIDRATGEIYDKSEYYLRSRKQNEAYLEKQAKQQAIMNGRSKNWVACYHEAIKSLTSKLSIEERGVVFLLLPYMNLRKKGELMTRGERMNVKNIAKAVGKSEAHMKRTLPHIVESGVLYKEREGKSIVYGISAEYHTIGKNHEGHFTKLYQQCTTTLKEEYDLTIQLAGMLYALLPYFHYHTYLLCTNPNEEDPQALDPMSDSELAELLAVDRSTINRLMNQLAKRGVVAKIGSHGVWIYRVNPDLMYRMKIETEYTEAVRADFLETMKLYRKEKALKSAPNDK